AEFRHRARALHGVVWRAGRRDDADGLPFAAGRDVGLLPQAGGERVVARDDLQRHVRVHGAAMHRHCHRYVRAEHRHMVPRAHAGAVAGSAGRGGRRQHEPSRGGSIQDRAGAGPGRPGEGRAVEAPEIDFDSPIERAGTWSVRWERYAGRDVIPLWVADTDFRPPPAVLAAMNARVQHGVFGYRNPPEALRQAIVERLARRYGWAVDPAWIAFLPGVVPGLHVSARRLLAADEHALLPTPLYQHFKRALELAPRDHTEIPLVLDNRRWAF